MFLSSRRCLSRVAVLNHTFDGGGHVPSADKTEEVAELTEALKSANGAVLTDYRGLSVAQLQELRRSLRGSANYRVVKNTLAKRAAANAGIASFENLLAGPSAIAFITGDVVDAAKGLKQFGKDNPALVVKGAFLDGAPVSPDELKQLADLESRDVLLAKLAGAMKGSLSQAAALFNAPLSGAARVMDALVTKAQEDPSMLAGTGDIASTDSQSSDDNMSSDSAEAPAEAPAESDSQESKEAPKEG
jgi:large subunit ribosomal protein L10